MVLKENTMHYGLEWDDDTKPLDWRFPKRMTTYVASSLLEELGFRDWENDLVPWNFKSITWEQLKDPEVRQAILTIIPRIDVARLVKKAKQNTANNKYRDPNTGQLTTTVDLKTGEVIPVGFLSPEREAEIEAERKKDEEEQRQFEEDKRKLQEEGARYKAEQEAERLEDEKEGSKATAELKAKEAELKVELEAKETELKKEEAEGEAERETDEEIPIETEAPIEVEGEAEGKVGSEEEVPIEAEGEAEGETEVEAEMEGESEEEEGIKPAEGEKIQPPEPEPAMAVKKPLAERDGSVAWRQGEKYKLIYPPYGQNNIITSSGPFTGIVVYNNAKSAYKALLEKHRGQLPPTVIRDMGITEMNVAGNNRSILQRKAISGQSVLTEM